jgi:uncharacterized protein
MPTLKFNNYRFEESKEDLIITFKNHYEFKIPLFEIEEISDYTLKKNTITFDCPEKVAEKKFNNLLNKHFKLTNRITKHPTSYIDQEIPLIGSLTFGIVDKGTNILELKPLTGCNSDCIFCSVDSGLSSKKNHDFLVDVNHLIEETNELVDFKRTEMHIYINPQGESLLYPDLKELITGLRKNKSIKDIIVITNGLLLNKKLIDNLIMAGITQFNVSISTFKNGKNILGHAINETSMKENLKLIADQNKLLICPVWMNNINDLDIEEIIKFGKEIKAKFGIQNYLKYPKGRTPTKELNFETFFEKLKALEDKYKVKLTHESLKLTETEEYPAPFKKNEIINAKIISKGSYKNERIAICKDRCITIMNCLEPLNKKVKIKLLRTRHNIFSGTKK